MNTLQVKLNEVLEGGVRPSGQEDGGIGAKADLTEISDRVDDVEELIKLMKESVAQMEAHNAKKDKEAE